MESFIGKYVSTKTHNHIGRVKCKHISFGLTGEDKRWFESQKPKLSKETLNKPWYSILCNNGGAVLVNEEEIYESQDTPIGGGFSNPWESFYFGEK